MPCARQKLSYFFLQMHFSKARLPPIKKHKSVTGLKISKSTRKKASHIEIFPSDLYDEPYCTVRTGKAQLQLDNVL